MRIVADTNTVVSALLWRGSPHRLVAAIEDHPIGFYTSRALLDELADVLGRAKLAAAVQATGKTPAQLLAEYQGFAQLVRPRLVRGVTRDPDDDHVIATAVAALTRTSTRPPTRGRALARPPARLQAEAFATFFGRHCCDEHSVHFIARSLINRKCSRRTPPHSESDGD